MNQNPVVRPNAEKVATSLDNLIRQTVLSIYKLDHKNEIDIKDNSLLNLYQNLLLKSPQEVDKIIEQIRLDESKKRTEEETLKFGNEEKKKDIKSPKVVRIKDKPKESPQKTPKFKRNKEDKKKPHSKDEKIESLEDDLFTKFDIKEAKQRSKIFRFSPKKKNRKGYNALVPEKTNCKEDIEREELVISPETKMDSARRSELTRSSTYNGPSRRPGPSVHQETKNNKKSTLPLPKRLSKRDFEVVNRNPSSPPIELSQ